ncbi:allatostatin-A receptor isoform X1 [Drosophila sulfurigaster albostrigata]|uniref:allatostatin-A receptor isoform X1 n=1 Tax=Drosophila sulfurigaster albostrigata TaxID=89887 RepID=UPI002D21B7E6|nr:allatostatin-A receptor isoform X1 [Drosophila sulfurigaster albostrigata]
MNENITLELNLSSSHDWLLHEVTTMSSINNGSNSTDNDQGFSYAEFEEIRSVIRWVVPICFGIIAITGFLGNLLVILVVVLNKNMHSTTNLLIVNLAAADLMFVIFCVPFTGIDYVTMNWPFGTLWCRTVQYLIVVTAYASIYTLVLMSVDRFLAVVHPIRSRMLRTEHITKIAIFTLWAVVLTISMPVTFAHDIVTLHDNNTNITMAFCRFTDNDWLHVSTYQVTFFTTSYLLPLMIISGLYVRMIMRLWRQGSGVRMSKESQRGRKRVTRLVVVVVIAFASLWLPVQLYMLLRALEVYTSTTMFTVILQVIAHTMAYTSSCINPLLYAFLSDNFRKAFYKAINCSNRYQNYTSDLPPPRKTSCARTSTTGL